jgi:hypothetical protein
VILISGEREKRRGEGRTQSLKSWKRESQSCRLGAASEVVPGKGKDDLHRDRQRRGLLG